MGFLWRAETVGAHACGGDLYVRKHELDSVLHPFLYLGNVLGNVLGDINGLIKRR